MNLPIRDERVALVCEPEQCEQSYYACDDADSGMCRHVPGEIDRC